MITIKVNKDTIEKIRKDYKDFITDENIGYIIFSAHKNDEIVTAYSNKKNETFKVTIQGDNALELAEKYNGGPLLLPKKEKPIKDVINFIDVDEQIGSDEVGFGDFLGPIVVCAAYVDHKTMEIINKFGIKDSKKLTDKKIMEVVPLFINKVFYEYKILSNERFNDATLKGFNMNKIKAILHNACLTKMKKRFPYVTNMYVDEFASKENYFNYLTNIKEVTHDLVFHTKGESYFPSVALASCISRYLFIKEMNYLSEKYEIKLIYGAGESADKCAQEIVNKKGIDTLKILCKQNFKNFDSFKNN